MPATGCASPSAPHIVRQLCQGRERCHFRPSEHIFGNPCQGVRKYARVEFACRSRRDYDGFRNFHDGDSFRNFYGRFYGQRASVYDQNSLQYQPNNYYNSANGE